MRTEQTKLSNNHIFFTSQNKKNCTFVKNKNGFKKTNHYIAHLERTK